MINKTKKGSANMKELIDELGKLSEIEEIYRDMEEFKDRFKKYSDEEFLARREEIMKVITKVTNFCYETQQQQKKNAVSAFLDVKSMMDNN